MYNKTLISVHFRPINSSVTSKFKVSQLPSRQTPGPSCPYPSHRPPSGHRPGRHQARHAHILQIGLRLAIAQADARPAMPISFRQAQSGHRPGGRQASHILQIGLHYEACGRPLGMRQPIGGWLPFTILLKPSRKRTIRIDLLRNTAENLPRQKYVWQSIVNCNWRMTPDHDCVTGDKPSAWHTINRRLTDGKNTIFKTIHTSFLLKHLL